MGHYNAKVKYVGSSLTQSARAEHWGGFLARRR